MARVWQEGFEDGLPIPDYLEGTPNSQFFRGMSMVPFPYRINLGSGRNAYSQKALVTQSDSQGTGNAATNYALKVLSSSASEVYLRVYFKCAFISVAFSPTAESHKFENIIRIEDASANVLAGLYADNVQVGSYHFEIKIGGALTNVASLTLADSTWYKIEIRLKTNASTGAYDVRVDDISLASASSQNTGSNDINNLRFGAYTRVINGTFFDNLDLYFDDIALNDTSGSANNSWCGNGTIVALKPKGAGNSSQWDTSQGYAVGESGTTTTNVKITAHGLATNDVCYNKTRDAYRIVTVVDADNFTVSSVTSQTTGDVFVNFLYQATITATATTDTSQVTIEGHTLISYDVTVNTTRSNAIRRVVYVSGNVVYNSYTTYANGTLGSTVTSQAAGNSIKTFKVKQYAIANHWEAVSKSAPNPQVCNIQTTTSGDIDLFDMQELVADLGIPSTATIVSVSVNIYAQEAGAGSEIKPVLRIGGANYEGTTIALQSGTLEYQTLYDFSPVAPGTNAFTRSEIDGMEAGVKLV